MANALSTSVRGLMAAGRAIATTSHNIANANTEGYSRQRVMTETSTPQKTGAGFIGTGVVVGGIDRIHNQIVEKQLQTNTTELNRLSVFNELADQVDSIMAEDTSGINSAQIEFFNALENSSNYPEGMGQQEVVLAAGRHLTNAFTSLDAQFDRIQGGINQSLSTAALEVNGISSAIVEVNAEIASALAYSQGDPPNDLLDYRDQLVHQLASFTNVSTIDRDDGGINITIGNGIPLVAGDQLFELTTVPAENRPGNRSIGIIIDGREMDLDSQLRGGSLGGANEFVDEMLDPMRAELGRMATSLTSLFNDVYRTLSDQPTAEFFTVATIPAFGSASNSGSGVAAAEVIDATAMTISDYALGFDGTEYTLTRLSDNTELTGPGDLIMDGIRFSVSPGAVAGDRFVIRPAVGVASQFELAISEPGDVVLAQTDAAGGVTAIGHELAEIQSTDLFGANTTFAEQYAAVSVRVGSAASLAELQLNSMQQVWQQTQDRHDSVSAVNLDEEAANLVKYQQAYEASARVISVAGGLFDTLIGTLNRI